jgi:hypothetical protein
MGARGFPAGGGRRLAIAAMAAGAVGGAVVGVGMLSGAAPASAPVVRPEILHVAPALVEAGADLALGASTVCDAGGTPSCDVVEAAALVRPADATSWSRIPGRATGNGFRFVVPASLVPPDGLSYRLAFRTADGAEVDYPPADDASVRVVTTEGLPEIALPPVRWSEVRAPDGVALSATFGSGKGQVLRREPAHPDQLPEGPSSFDVGPDGSVYVVDPLAGAVEVYSRRGAFRRSIPLPARAPMDLAVGADGSLALSTLGMDAQAFEVAPDGRVIGRYPVGYGVVARVAATASGPRVLVGPAQWAPVRSVPGIPLSGARQADGQTSAVARSDGSIGVSGELPGGRVAVAWTDPDGTRSGAVLRLPAGLRAGTDYFVRPTRDGGAVVARGLWNDRHFAVGLIRLAPSGALRSFSLLPEPSTEQAARFSTVRFRAPDEVLLARTGPRALSIDVFEVR